MSGCTRRRAVDGLGHRAGLRDDLELVASVEQRDEALADHLVVVHDEEPQRPPHGCLRHRSPPVGAVGSGSAARVGMRTVMVVPALELSMSNVPPRSAARARMLRESTVLGAAVLIDREPDAVVGDGKAHAPAVGTQQDGGTRSLRVTRHVAEGLAQDLEQFRPTELARVRQRIAGRELDVDEAVHTELVDECGGPGDEPGLPGEVRLQPEDEVADVADREVQGVDGAVDASRGLVGVRAHQVGHVLQCEPDGVDPLDDPVVEIVADPDPLVGDREALDLLVETRVLDGHPGVKGEHLDKSLVVARELGGAAFVRRDRSRR